jgi:hypothetical protein
MVDLSSNRLHNKIRTLKSGGALLKTSRVTILIAALSLAVLVGCVESKSPEASFSPSTSPLEEKSLPPVFNNMNLLRGAYRSGMCFVDDATRFILGTLPEQLDAEFNDLAMNSGYPTVPETLTAYKVIRPGVDATYAQDLAKRLGFSQYPMFFSTDKTYRSYLGDVGNDPVVSIYPDGSISIWWDRTRQKPQSLPSDQECVEIAREWLTSHGLYPDNVVDVQASPRITHLMTGRVESEYTSAIAISFHIGFDGLEIFGMGAYLVIGESGKILEAHINAPKFEPYSVLEVQTPQWAISTFKEYMLNPDKFRVDSPRCLIREINRFVEINRMTLQYFPMQSLDESQPAFLQPIYVLEGIGRNAPDLNWDSFVGGVDAASSRLATSE